MSDGKTEALRGTYFSNKKTKKIKQELPDARKHQIVSFIKSTIRLAACGFGFFGMFELGFIWLFLAELVGIGEELV